MRAPLLRWCPALLALGCMQSALAPREEPVPAPQAALAARSGEGMTAAVLPVEAGGRESGFDLLALPERELVIQPASRRASAPPPAPVPVVAQKRLARQTDPAPAASAPASGVARRSEEPSAASAEERKPFLRPAAGRGVTTPTAAQTKPAEPAQPVPAMPGQTRPSTSASPPPAMPAVASPSPAPASTTQTNQKVVKEIPDKVERPADPPPPPATATPVPLERTAAPAAPVPAASNARPVAESRPAVADAAPPKPAGGIVIPPDARFQVQIMSTSNPEGAEDMRAQAALVFPDELVEVVWDPPNYKVRVGAVSTQEAAVELKRRALRLGFQNAWVVPRRQS